MSPLAISIGSVEVKLIEPPSVPNVVFFLPPKEDPTWTEFQPQPGGVDFKYITKQWQSGKKSEVLHQPMGEH